MRRAQAATLAVRPIPAAARRRRAGDRDDAASSSICRRIIRGPNRWIPDGELGRRVRFLDRFFDLHVMGNMQRPVTDALRPEGTARRVRRASARENGCTSPTTGSRRTCGDGPWAAGEQFTLADCAAAPSLFYADWVEEIGARAPEAWRLSRAPARPSDRRSRGRRGPAVPALISRSAHPTATKRRPATSAAADRLRSPRASRRFVAAVAAVLVGMIAAHQRRIGLAQRVAVGVVAKAEHRQRLALGAC